MHILFLNSWYPSRIFPTNGDFVQRHAEAVSVLHEVTSLHVVTAPKLNVKIQITDEQINNVRTLIAYIQPSNYKILKLVRFFNAYRSLIKRTNNVDFIHVNHIYPAGVIALYLKMIKGLNYIVTEHWTGFHNTNKLPWNNIISNIIKLVVKKAKYMCPVTNDLAIAMSSLGLKGNYFPVPNVVNTDIFSIKQGRRNERFTIIHVSNMDDNHKNISGLIRAIGRFQEKVMEFDFYMIGNQPTLYKDYLIEVGVKPTNVHFIHNLPQEELKKYMQIGDIFVLFSNEENLPCVILESFSCGVPVISTNVGGINEFFPHDFGRLITIGDEDELLNELLKVYSGSTQFSLPDVMHQYAVQNFNNKQIAEQFSVLYNSK